MIPPLLARWLTIQRIVFALAIASLSIPAAFPHPGEEAFSHAGLAGVVRVLGAMEIVGALMLLVPALVRFGGWTLIAVFCFAIALHLLHGERHVGALVIYLVTTAVILAADSAGRISRRP